jgi:hypothetical protein
MQFRERVHNMSFFFISQRLKNKDCPYKDRNPYETWSSLTRDTEVPLRRRHRRYLRRETLRRIQEGGGEESLPSYQKPCMYVCVCTSLTIYSSCGSAEWLQWQLCHYTSIYRCNASLNGSFSTIFLNQVSFCIVSLMNSKAVPKYNKSFYRILYNNFAFPWSSLFSFILDCSKKYKWRVLCGAYFFVLWENYSAMALFAFQLYSFMRIQYLLIVLNL